MIVNLNPYQCGGRIKRVWSAGPARVLHHTDIRCQSCNRRSMVAVKSMIYSASMGIIVTCSGGFTVLNFGMYL